MNRDLTSPESWTERGRHLWSVPGGRFDILRTPWGTFVAFDWDFGVRAVFATGSDARAWAESRQQRQREERAR